MLANVNLQGILWNRRALLHILILFVNMIGCIRLEIKVKWLYIIIFVWLLVFLWASTWFLMYLDNLFQDIQNSMYTDCPFCFLFYEICPRRHLRHLTLANWLYNFIIVSVAKSSGQQTLLCDTSYIIYIGKKDFRLILHHQNVKIGRGVIHKHTDNRIEYNYIKR